MANFFSAEQFRKKALLCQGLLRRGSFGRGKVGVLNCIRHLGYIQIDTISVVERAHHHVLWSRVPGYGVSMLSDLIRSKDIFEYWSHAAAYLPIEDFRFALPKMNAIKRGEKHWFASKNKKLMRRIYQRIKDEGPLMARDFDDRRSNTDGWWDWKPAKQALEQLFIEGDLMVVERRGFQKVYDLTERVLPSTVNTVEPDVHELVRHFINMTIRAHGFASPGSFTYLRRGRQIRESLKEQLRQRVQDKTLIETKLPCGSLVYADTEIISRKRIAENVKILSPFDNCVIQRERCKKVFDFDFQIECYVPESKRIYGYFSLPLLFHDQFVGRMDCKADRHGCELKVKSLHLDRVSGDNFYHELWVSLQEFAEFNQCENIVIEGRTASANSLARYVQRLAV